MKTYRISSSQLNEYQNCGRKFFFSRILRKGTFKLPYYLERGTLIHKLLETYYNLIKDKKDRTSSIYDAQEIIRPTAALYDLTPEQIEETFFQFRENILYWRDAGDNWEPLEVEAPFSLEIYNDSEMRILYEGKIDLIVDTPVGKTIVDHKSEGQDEPKEALDNQFLGYALISVHLGFLPIIYVNRIGFQKTKKPSDRFHRQPLSYDREVLEDFKTSMIWWVKDIVKKSEEGYFPPRFISCGSCQFKRVCNSAPGIRSWKLDTMFKTKEDSFDLFAKDDKV